MWESTAETPERVARSAAAVTEALSTEGLPAVTDLSAVVVIGSGASSTANDVLSAVVGPTLSVPLVVVDGYELPFLVGPSTLVLASSFSGNTAETLAAASAAVERGARLVVITGDGSLGALARDAGAPVVVAPSSRPHPRVAIGAMVVAGLVVLETIGLIEGVPSAVASAVRQLSVRRDRAVADRDAGAIAIIARRIGRTIPLVYGGGAIGGVAALHWKRQVNKNPKSPAFAARQPDVCHHEITGWGQMGDVTRQLMTVVDLRHDFEHPEVARRFELVAEIMDEVVAGVIDVRAGGDGPLAQVLDLMLVGDYVSLWLAAREGVDPGPAPVVAQLEEALAEPLRADPGAPAPSERRTVVQPGRP